MGVTLTGALFQAESQAARTILGAGRPGKLLCEIPHPADLRRVGEDAFQEKGMLRAASYSARNVVAGSICAARHAGRPQAITDTAASSAITPR
jgi:hypothetical protein